MQSPILNIVVKATDLASSTFSRITNSMTGQILQANLISTAFQKVGESVQFVNSKINEASQLQLSNMNAASIFAALTGSRFDEGSRFIDELNDKLAKSAAALPGATQDYKNLAITIQDNLLPAFKNAQGKLDTKAFGSGLASVTESYGVLATANGIDSGNAGLALSNLFGGSSIAELKQIEFFEKNPAVINALEEKLKQMGKTSFKDVDSKEAFKVIDEVGKKFVTDDLKKRASNSVDGLIQSFKSSIFDPTSGIFGLMRDLDPEKEGIQSAFNSWNDILKDLIGEDGTFTRFGKLLKAIGVKLIDPMVVLKAGFDKFNKALKFVNEIIKAVSTYLTFGSSWFDALKKTEKELDILGTVKRVFKTIGIALGNVVNRIGIGVSWIIEKLPGLISDWVIGGLNFMTNYIKTFNASDMAMNSVNGLEGIFLTIGATLLKIIKNIKWGEVLISLGTFLDTALKSGVPTVLFSVAYISNFLLNAIAAGIGAIAPIIAGAIPAIIATGPFLIVGAIGFSFGYWLGTKLLEWWNSEGEAKVKQWWSDTTSWLSDKWNSFWGGVADGLLYFVDGLNQWWSKAVGKIQETVSKIPGLGGLAPQIPPSNLSANTNVPPAFKGHIPNAANGFIGAFGPGDMSGKAIRGSTNIVSAFKGHIPNAANGLLSAAVRETKAMPSGSNLVMANSSETIIPRGKELAIKNRVGNINFNPVFNISGNNTNPQELAQMVLNELDKALNQYAGAKLA